MSSQGYICPQKRCCTPPSPPAGIDSCLLRDTSVPTEVLNTTCRDRQLSSLGYICPQKGNVHLPCHLLGQTAVFPGTRLTRQSVGKLVGTMSCWWLVQMLLDLLQVMYTLATSMHWVCQMQEEVKCKRMCMFSALPLLSAMELGCFGTLSTYDSKAKRYWLVTILRLESKAANMNCGETHLGI